MQAGFFLWNIHYVNIQNFSGRNMPIFIYYTLENHFASISDKNLDRIFSNEVWKGDDFAIVGMFFRCLIYIFIILLRKLADYRGCQWAGVPRGPVGACAQGLHHRGEVGPSFGTNNFGSKKSKISKYVFNTHWIDFWSERSVCNALGLQA